jgi:hypothetical protein
MFGASGAGSAIRGFVCMALTRLSFDKPVKTARAKPGLADDAPHPNWRQPWRVEKFTASAASVIVIGAL